MCEEKIVQNHVPDNRLTDYSHDSKLVYQQLVNYIYNLKLNEVRESKSVENLYNV